MHMVKALVVSGLTLFTTATPMPGGKGALIPPPELPDKLGERRGIAYNRPDFVTHFAVQGTHAKWAYNWASKTQGLGATVWYEFVPMLHSNHSDHTGPWKNDVEAAAIVVPENPTHLLGFNEPDMCQPGAGGTCMDVESAVATWQKYMEPHKALKDKMYFGSPAVSNSGAANEGLSWLSNFLNQCHDCKVDFICIHWYGSFGEAEIFKAHIEEARKVAQGRPIWITEFKAEGTDEQQKEFMDKVIPWLDNTSDIHRYAYFMARPELLINNRGTGMSGLGEHYNFMWTKDGKMTEPPTRRDGKAECECYDCEAGRCGVTFSCVCDGDMARSIKQGDVEGATAIEEIGLPDVSANGRRWRCIRNWCW